MIYEYLDKWLTERCWIMEILLSSEIHRIRHAGFSDHLNLLAGQLSLSAVRTTALLFTPHTEYLNTYELISYTCEFGCLT